MPRRLVLIPLSSVTCWRLLAETCAMVKLRAAGCLAATEWEGGGPSACSHGARSIWVCSSAVSGNPKIFGSAWFYWGFPLFFFVQLGKLSKGCLTPTRSRVPISCLRLKVVVFTCLADGARQRGNQQRVWWSMAPALWTGLLVFFGLVSYSTLFGNPRLGLSGVTAVCPLSNPR